MSSKPASPTLSPPRGAPWRVLVADDQMLVRAGVEALLARLSDFRCVATVDSGQACLQACAEAAEELDLVLLDVRMPGLDGWQVAATLRQRHPRLKLLFLTAQFESAQIARAMAEGLLGVVCKDFVLDELEHALRSAVTGRPYLSPQLALASFDSKPGCALSPRQTEVLRAIAGGRSNKEIARELGLSVKTVEFHRAELIQRLDLHDVASLTRYALEQGLV